MKTSITYFDRLFALSMGVAVILLASSFTSYNKITSSYDFKDISASKKVKYQKDATRLALRLISNNKDYQNQEAEVPSEMVNSIYNALVSVHFNETKEAQQVTKTHKLHTFPVPAIDNFLVVYKRDAAWAKPLRLGDNTTSSDDINALCEKYNLIIDNNVEWDEEHNSFNVRALKGLNIAAIIGQFEGFEGVSKVDILQPNGDGNDIEIVENNDGWTITYIVKFDSCFINCKKSHSWKFDVNNAGEVKFIEESGDELPVWMAAR